MRNKLIRLWVLLSALGITSIAHAQEAGGEAPLVPLPVPRDTDIASAIWVLISFVILVVILKKAAWNNVLASLKGREDRIRGNIAESENARAKAEAMLKEHEAKMAGADEQIRLMLQKAATEAEKIAANIRTQAQAEGEAERDRTRKEIEGAKRDAIRQIYEQAGDLAVRVASKIIGRNLNAADQVGLVNQTLDELQTLGRR